MGEVGGSRERRKSISETLGLSIPHQLMEAAPRKTDSALKGISSSSNNIGERPPIHADPEKEGLPSINYFCIFTTKLGQKEDDRHEQILYYGTRHNFNQQPSGEQCLEYLEDLEDAAGDFTTRLPDDTAPTKSGSGERQHHVPLDTQVRQVGLAQAMINFSKIFSPEAPCENVHSKKARLVFFEPEQDFHFSFEHKSGSPYAAFGN
ncbi:hypothetical protein DSO57_1002893 [Entomophthora muscae]|uniref:Uncharacterized protein n=1 Tax=Entomophthora muscae TaxID=34485 RepID=A0ACC2SL83_9FUNG|nr:hypothetical protein DSO57_1002893 [Entomophthora muscae]